MGITLTVDFFVAADGSAPALVALAEFAQQSVDLRDAVIAGINRISVETIMSENFIRHVSSNLWCLCITIGAQQAGLFLALLRDRRAFLLNGFVTTSGTIPGDDIKEAQRLIELIRMEERRYVKQAA